MEEITSAREEVLMQFHCRLHQFCIFAAEASAEVDPAHVQTVRAAVRGGVRIQVLRGSISGLEVRPGAVQVRTRGKYTGMYTRIIAPFFPTPAVSPLSDRDFQIQVGNG